MENLKIKAKNLDQKNEIINLFILLGYKEDSLCTYNNDDLMGIHVYRNGDIQDVLNEDYSIGDHKEITFPELRDLVVLKRNDRKDANVSEENCLYDLYLTESKELYFYHCGKNKWILSNLNGDDNYYESLKPIEKPMKEYLNKLTDGTYKLVVLSDLIDGHDGLIEIPEGAEIYTKYDGSNEFYKSKNGIVYRFDRCYWFETNWDSISKILKECDRRGFDVLWQRHTQLEELPFVDDKCYTNKSNGVFKLPKDKPCDISKWSELRGESLNDQYAEIEQVRQESQAGANIPVGRCQEADTLFADAVNHPSHYASGEIECIDAMEAMLTPGQFIGYLRGNAFKYQWRYENKGGITDLEKAQWYLNKLISRIS